jgi:hypothetical protein
MTNEELFAKTALANWKLVISRLDGAFSAFSDAELQTEVAPGKNRVYYLLGHLTAVHDRLFPMFDLGARLHPELDEEFLTRPDAKVDGALTAAALRSAWTDVNGKLLTAMEAMKPEDWLLRHTAVSAEDFAKEPLRNRLSVLQSRTGHAAFHAGQIRLAK